MQIYRIIAVFILSISLTACGTRLASGLAVPGVKNYEFSIQNGQARLSVVFPSFNIDAGARIPLGKPAGAFVELSPDFESGGMLFIISAPLASLLNGGGLPTMGLPDGRALPGVRGGVLPATGLALPAIGTTILYMGRDVFGLFIPVNLGSLPLTVTVKIRDQQGNLMGTVAAIPKGFTGRISGVLFLFPIEGTAAASALYSQRETAQ